MRMALIQGMENANKTVSHFCWRVNGGFLEGVGWCELPTLGLMTAFVGTYQYSSKMERY
jgi:hypothetical protein